VNVPETTPGIPGRARARWRNFPVQAQALVLFFLIGSVVFAAVWSGARGPISPAGNQDLASYPGSAIFGGWFRYDGRWYDLIVTKGYWFNGPTVQSSVAYFPGYPIVLWILHFVTGISVKLLGSIVTIACGAGVAVLFVSWSRLRATDRVVRIAVITMLLYPYAFYLMGAVYGDALFLVAALGAFVLLERDHAVLAGLAGAVATATRPVGIALIVGLIAITLWRRHVIESGDSRLRMRIMWRRLRWSDSGVLLSFGGLLGYMTFLGIRFGHPFAFDEVQQAPGWDQAAGPRTWLKITWFQQIKNLPSWFIDWIRTGDTATFERVMYAATVIMQGLFVLGFLFLAWQVWRRFGWGYGFYSFALLAIPLLGTKDFQGSGRYLLTAFPCFLALGALFEGRAALRWTWWGLSAFVLLAWAFAFGSGYYVA
jgi:hypothetical protein